LHTRIAAVGPSPLDAALIRALSRDLILFSPYRLFVPVRLITGLTQIGHPFSRIVERPTDRFDVENDLTQLVAHHDGMLLVVSEAHVAVPSFQMIRK
jgi:hypothetical protein